MSLGLEANEDVEICQLSGSKTFRSLFELPTKLEHADWHDKPKLFPGLHV